MKPYQSLITLAALWVAPLTASYALECADGTPVSVAGRVTTLNVSQTRQAGQICLTLTNGKGREVFDDCGALLGKITASDPDTGTSTLNHTAVFDLPHTFRTANDQAQITGVLAVDESGLPCAFSVVEHITQVSTGTGIFRRATMDAYATGSISFCPGNNLNTFSLSGQTCLRK